MRPELESGKSTGFERAAQEVLVDVASGRQLAGDKGNADGVQPCLDLEVNIGGSAVNGRASGDFLVPVVNFDTFAIDHQFELFALDFAKRAIVVHQALVNGEDLENVVAVGGEFVFRDQSAARSEGQTVDVIILRSIGRHTESHLNLLGGIANRQAADLFGCRGVAFE